MLPQPLEMSRRRCTETTESPMCDVTQSRGIGMNRSCATSKLAYIILAFFGLYVPNPAIIELSLIQPAIKRRPLSSKLEMWLTGELWGVVRHKRRSTVYDDLRGGRPVAKV